MFDSAVLEVGIGLTLVYLVLSLVATVFLELWLEVRQWRGRALLRHACRVLGNEPAMLLYADERVRSLMTGKAAELNGLAKAALPATVGARATGLVQQARQCIEKQPGGRLPSYVPEGVVADILLDWMTDPASGVLMPPASANVGGTPVPLAPDLQATWERLFREADGDRAAMRAALVGWFQNSTDRLKGEFRRSSKIGLMIVGVVLAVTLDVSTITIATRLHADEALRRQLVEVAVAMDAQCKSDPSSCRAPPTTEHVDTSPAPSQVSGDPAAPAQQQDLSDAATSTPAAAGDLVPGVKQETWRPDYSQIHSAMDNAFAGLFWLPGSREHSLLAAPAGTNECIYLALLIVGYLLTALAISLGSDFWFGALQKLVRIRNARETKEAEANADAAISPVTGATIGTSAQPPGRLADTGEIEALAGFRLDHTESLCNAYWLAVYANLAYENRSLVATHPLAKLNGTRIEPIEAGDTQAILALNANSAVLAFRGTEKSVSDFWTDAQFRLADVDWDPGFKVHTGFGQALELIWPTLLGKIAEHSEDLAGKPLWITGHSLGGALAVLAAHRLHRLPLIRGAGGVASPVGIAGVYTFGQPRVGDAAFSRRYDQQLGRRTFRFVNHADIVPTVPPAVMVGADRYEHLGQYRYFDAAGALNHHLSAIERWLDRLLPSQGLSQAPESITQWARQQVAERVGDHAMTAYLACLRAQREVRALPRKPLLPTSS